VSLDEASKFLKPVLTFNEALVVLGEMDWEELCRKGWFESNPPYFRATSRISTSKTRTSDSMHSNGFKTERQQRKPHRKKRNIPQSLS
jgi:hypothetical protein